MNTFRQVAVAALTLVGSMAPAFSAVNGGPHRVKAPMPEITELAPGDFNPVNSLPEGAVSTTMAKSGACYITIDPTYTIMQKIDGFVAEVATLDDKIYVGPIISLASYPLSYLVGTVEDGIATFEFPQPLGYYALADEEDYAILYNMSLSGDNVSLKLAEEQVIKYYVGEDGSLELMSEYSNCYMTDAVYMDGAWYRCGIGDVLMSCTPLKAEPQGFPEGVTVEEYNLVSGTQARKVNVAVDGTDFYVSGLYRDLPDGVVKGELKDGKVVFEGGQFLGIDDNFHCCVNAYAAKVETIDDPDYGTYDALTQISGPFEFTVNSSLSELNLGSTPICFAPGLDMVGALTSMVECSLTKPDPDADILVSKPVIDTYYPADSQYYAQLYFYIPNISADGKVILDEDKFYWCLYIDGEPYTFEPDEYDGLTEAVDFLPYKFANGSDIEFFPEMGLQGVVIYPEGFESLGVQAIYKDGDNEFRSEIAYAVASEEEEGGISDAEAAEVSTEYFDLSGRKVSGAGCGLLIQRTVTASGEVKTKKIIK